MSLPLGAVEFLARSENRVRALTTLADRQCDRTTLAETMGVSRVTAQRILADFERYGWVVADGRTYRATAIGSIVAEAFESLLTTVEATQRLAAVAPWLPTEFDVDLRRLTDARITLPTHGDPIAPVRRSTALMEAATSVRGLGTGIAPTVLRSNRNSVVDDGQSLEVIFSEDVLTVIFSDTQMSGWLHELLAAGATVYRHADVGLLLGEFDGEVIGLGVGDESGIPRGFIESCDPEVRDWFERTYTRYRAAAEPVERDAFRP